MNRIIQIIAFVMVCSVGWGQDAEYGMGMPLLPSGRVGMKSECPLPKGMSEEAAYQKLTSCYFRHAFTPNHELLPSLDDQSIRFYGTGMMVNRNAGLLILLGGGVSDVSNMIIYSGSLSIREGMLGIMVQDPRLMTAGIQFNPLLRSGPSVGDPALYELPGYRSKGDLYPKQALDVLAAEYRVLGEVCGCVLE